MYTLVTRCVKGKYVWTWSSYPVFLFASSISHRHSRNACAGRIDLVGKVICILLSRGLLNTGWGKYVNLYWIISKMKSTKATKGREASPLTSEIVGVVRAPSPPPRLSLCCCLLISRCWCHSLSLSLSLSLEVISKKSHGALPTIHAIQYIAWEIHLGNTALEDK